MKQAGSRIEGSFYRQDSVSLARSLVGQTLVRRFTDGQIKRYRITETEAYCWPDDKACHAFKGRTSRTSVMFGEGGRVYVYLIYGMYWLLNIVSGAEGEGTAVLIRGLEGISGPGRVGRELMLDKTFYGEDLSLSDRIWVERGDLISPISATPRIGIDYAGEPWVSMPWRFVLTKGEKEQS